MKIVKTLNTVVSALAFARLRVAAEVATLRRCYLPTPTEDEEANLESAEATLAQIDHALREVGEPIPGLEMERTTTTLARFAAAQCALPLDQSERGQLVTVMTRAGERFQGRITAVRDVFGLEAVVIGYSSAGDELSVRDHATEAGR